MFIVTLTTSQVNYLRGTIWSMNRDRATEYATRELAQAALDKAKQFMGARQYKAARIEG